MSGVIFAVATDCINRYVLSCLKHDLSDVIVFADDQGVVARNIFVVLPKVLRELALASRVWPRHPPGENVHGAAQGLRPFVGSG